MTQERRTPPGVSGDGVMLGRRIGSWVLTRELGRGGMGAVFEARHASLQTLAAVKVLSPGLEPEATFRQRFRREAELQAQLRHPNVARVLDYVEAGGQWFLVMEYLDRGSMAERLSRGEKIPPEQAIAWTKQALAGLGYAHRKGVIHRDVKPANLMFNEGGEIVVVDFGIARDETLPGLTATGLTIGTPHYMSPEQIETPNRVDGRADIYSLGIVLYEMLAGRKPFEGRSNFSLLQAQVTESPQPLRTLDPAIPPDLEAVVMRALAKDRDSRYPDCESMARALDLRSDRLVNGAPAAVDGGTVAYSRMFERAATPPADQRPAAEQRDRRRRSLQRVLTVAAVTVVAIAAFLASVAAGARRGTGSTDTSNTTVTVGATDTANTTHATDTSTSATTSNGSSPGKPPIDPGSGNVGQRFNGSDTNPVTPPVQPPLVPVLPPAPQIAVVGTGSDSVFAGVLEQELERRLRETHRVADEHADFEIDEMLRTSDVAPAAIGAQLLKGGFHVLVLVRVEEGDRRTIRIRGEPLSMKAARIRMNAYLLPVRRTIGTGWTELVEYNELSLNEKAKTVFIGATADLRQSIDQEWAQLRAASVPEARAAP